MLDNSANEGCRALYAGEEIKLGDIGFVTGSGWLPVDESSFILGLRFAPCFHVQIYRPSDAVEGE